MVLFMDGSRSPTMARRVAMAYCLMLDDTAGVIDTAAEVKVLIPRATAVRLIADPKG